MKSPETKLKANLKLSNDFSKIHLEVRDYSRASELRNLIVEKYPYLKWKRMPNGASIDPFEASRQSLFSLLDLDLQITVEASQLLRNRNFVCKHASQVEDNLSQILEGGLEASKRFLEDIADLSILDDHQWINVAAMTVKDGYGLALFDEQGAGKTVTTIFTYDVLVERDEVDFALIFAPKSMIAEWQNDFYKFRNDMYSVRTLSGTRQEKTNILRQGSDVLITNFETALSMEDELTALVKLFKGRSILIVDESFYVKNLNAKRTVAIKRLREWFGRAYVLCGTPAPNSPHDLIEQINIVDFGLTFSGEEIPDEKAKASLVIQELIEKKGVFIRHLKSDVLPELPSKSIQRVMLELQPVQNELYVAALNELVTDLKSTTDIEFLANIASFLARRSALIRICSNPIGLTEGYAELPTKILALDEILNEIILNQREKVVLWSFYRSSIDTIFHKFKDIYGAVRYDGTIPDIAVRRKAVHDFQNDDTTMLFVANPAAAGAGLTLHRAKFAIYESMSNQAAHYLQSLDRIHRRGQTRAVEYIVLLCNETIEVDEFERLLEKEKAGKKLLGDPIIQEVTRGKMLAETISLLEKKL